MKFGTSVVIFFLAIVALVAELVLYFIVGFGAAFSGNLSALSGAAFFFVSLMVLTVATGILAPICALIELATKKRNSGLYVMLPTLGLILSGLVIFSVTGRHTFKTAKPQVAPTANATAPAAPASGELPSAGKWVVNETTSPMDSSKGVSLLLDSEDEIDAWLGSHKPTLVIRCQEGKTDSYIVTGTAANPEFGEDNFAVRLRFDGAKPVTERWSQSTDSRALFSPHAAQFAKRLAKAKMLTFQFTPFNASPAVARFDVQGLTNHLSGLAKACRWADQEAAYEAATTWAEVYSWPSSATVSVDGEDVGLTPLTVQLAPGNHKIRIAKSGYSQWESPVAIRPGRTEHVEVKLTKDEQ